MSIDETTLDRLSNETVELLQALIRNQCVNDGRPESGQEDVSARLLRDELEGTGVDMQMYEPTPGRSSLVARYPGTDPDAPALCLMGHTDVVPVSPDGWDRDPFGGELVDGEVWGRGAVDMLNLTSSSRPSASTRAPQSSSSLGFGLYSASRRTTSAAFTSALSVA